MGEWLPSCTDISSARREGPAIRSDEMGCRDTQRRRETEGRPRGSRPAWPPPTVLAVGNARTRIVEWEL